MEITVCLGRASVCQQRKIRMAKVSVHRVVRTVVKMREMTLFIYFVLFPTLCADWRSFSSPVLKVSEAVGPLLLHVQGWGWAWGGSSRIHCRRCVHLAASSSSFTGKTSWRAFTTPFKSFYHVSLSSKVPFQTFEVGGHR